MKLAGQGPVSDFQAAKTASKAAPGPARAACQARHSKRVTSKIDKIALVAPSAKLNIIKEYEITEKREVKVPDEIKGIAKCMNPNCITNNQNVLTKFRVTVKNGNISLRCNYCEKITDEEHMEIIQ
jgi:aspartate carbamoyltransferase regulatory subunit